MHATPRLSTPPAVGGWRGREEGEPVLGPRRAWEGAGRRWGGSRTQAPFLTSSS